MPRLIGQMRTALGDLAAGRVQQPVRSIVNVNAVNGFLGVMPAFSQQHGLGAKLVTFFPQNSALGIPSHHAIVLLFSPKTGQLTAMLDGEVITELRTAACSAVATDVLATKRDILCILGSGVQARSHIQALSCSSRWKEIRIWSRTAANAERLAQELQSQNLADIVRHCTTAEAAVREADVIVVATSSSTPVLQGAWVKPGAHVNAVGACRPDWREMDDELMQNAVVIVDSRAGALKESGDVIGSSCTIAAELGSLVNGQASVDKMQTTVFKSLGMAIEDVSAGQLVVDAMGSEGF